MDGREPPPESRPLRPIPEDLAAKRRRSFGSSAAAYAAYRPTYPLAAVRWLSGEPTKDVLDLGAGTGMVAALAQELGHNVVGVEPDPLMREEAELLLPGLVQDGRAEAIPLADRSTDAVLVGQAWHWFDQEQAEDEIARVLRPGGVLGLMWNFRDETEPWMQRLGAIVGGEDRTGRGGGLEPPQFGAAFGSPELRHTEHRQALPVEDFLRLVNTWSFVATRPDRDRVLAEVEALVATEHPVGGEIAVPYTCIAIRVPLQTEDRRDGALSS